jgi:thiamine biosynthesis lipoprotein
MRIFLQFLLLLIGLSCLPIGSLSAQDWLQDYQEAQSLAIAQQKPILLYFSGSDWCAPCVRLKKEVFSSPTFVDFASQQLILLEADFPRRKKNALSSELQQQNEWLAERFNKEGTFPKILLLQGDLKLIAEIPYNNQFPDELVQEIQRLIPQKEMAQQELFQQEFSLMGSRFEIALVWEKTDAATADAFIREGIEEIRRIEQLISSWDPQSQTSRINRAAGQQAVPTDPELLQLILRAQRISELTQGAFDISFASMDPIWKFDGSMDQLPDSARVKAARSTIDFRNIEVDEAKGTVFLRQKGMRIGFGAIGKGYAAQRVKQLLIDRGVESGIVNAGGDLIAWGRQLDGTTWKIGIADPNQEEKIFSWLPVEEKAVATSGDYERFVEFEGQTYAHIIDPRTGYPVTGVKSVSVICKDAELADALATSAFVLGVEVGMDLINQLPGVDCLIIDMNNQIHTSEDLILSAHANNQ